MAAVWTNTILTQPSQHTIFIKHIEHSASTATATLSISPANDRPAVFLTASVLPRGFPMALRYSKLKFRQTRLCSSNQETHHRNSSSGTNTALSMSSVAANESRRRENCLRSKRRSPTGRERDLCLGYRKPMILGGFLRRMIFLLLLR
ncbi:hypothetical protein ABFS83_11G060000 [Erythranthe nasuta]